MNYEVFDSGINRHFGVYATEEEAMTLVRASISANGKEYAEDLNVGYERSDGTSERAITGAALLARADEVLADQQEVDSGPGRVIAARRFGGGSGSSDRTDAMAAKGYRCAPSSPRKSAPARGTSRATRPKRR